MTAPVNHSFADEALRDVLPEVRGSIAYNVNMAETTWFRVGGPAEVLFKPADVEDLAYFLENTPDSVPITVVGLASNLLIRDGGIPGVVVRLGPTFATIAPQGSAIRAGAAAVDLNVARAAQIAGITGMEFLCGIPGTVGGGLRMNAGSYGKEFKDITVEAEILDRDGVLRILSPEAIGFGYRHSAVADDAIFVSALLQGDYDNPATIHQRMQEIQKSRLATQPIRERTGGSTFANPDNDPKNHKAWQLIEEAGCRGLKIGQAKVSEKHCNFLINTGYATAAEIEHLGEEVRRRVREKTGIELRWEIRRIGIPGSV